MRALRDEGGRVGGVEQADAELLGDKVAKGLGVGKADDRLLVAVAVGHAPELAEALVLPDPDLGLEGEGPLVQ